MSTVKEFQTTCKAKLENIFPYSTSSNVAIEWTSMAGEKDIYCPRVDIAIGPFNNIPEENVNYNEIVDCHASFLYQLIDCHILNLRNFNNNSGIDLAYKRKDFVFESLKQSNINPRCFLIAEIENKVSRKHIIGGIINACAIAKIGILVAWTPDKLKAFIKAFNYFHFLKNVGKNTFSVDNMLILDRDQFLNCINFQTKLTKNI